MNLLKLNLHHRPHHHIHSFRHRHEEIKLGQTAQFFFFPAREQKLKHLLSYGAPYESSTGDTRYVNLHDVKPFSIDKNGEEEDEFEECLAKDGEVYQKTLRLVQCAMFAAVSGLAFFLSNSLAIVVATSVLLFVLFGPVKAITYLLLHGLLGFTMGTIWRLKASWAKSISNFLCKFELWELLLIMTASYLIGENIRIGY